MIEEKRQNNETWTSVDKALPDEFEKVLVWIRWRNRENVGYMYGFSYQVEGIWYGDAFGASREVMAWMPLPPAYEGEAE